jgi:beta-lactamase
MSRDDLERLVAETFDAAGVPGGVLHVVDAQGPRETVEYGGLAASDPVTLGSTSKALAATVLLQLAEEGLVDLHAPVQRYLPGVGLPRRSRCWTLPITAAASGRTPGRRT